ncbi:MAG: hypothetical protein ACE5G1_04475 [bacterium]
MDTHDASLAIPQATNPNAIGDRKYPQQQKRDENPKKKKEERPPLVGKDQAIINGKTITLKKSKKSDQEEDPSPHKGDVIDIRV